MVDFDLRIISLGAGVQSTAMYLMALDGELTPKPDYAIFADTQREPPWVYENLWRLAEEGGDEIPILIGTTGDIGDAILSASDVTAPRFAAIPFWVENDSGKESPGRRQCTREYKIDVVQREVRRLLGLKPRQRAAGKFAVEQWIGISLDEVSRAKPSRYSWVTTRWPLLMDKAMRRYQAKEWLRCRGWPEVEKSSCVFCPYRRASEYAAWRRDHPLLFEEACSWDDRLRANGATERLQYVTRLLVPLRQLPPIEELDGSNDRQLNLFENECEGMCGV